MNNRKNLNQSLRQVFTVSESVSNDINFGNAIFTVKVNRYCTLMGFVLKSVMVDESQQLSCK